MRIPHGSIRQQKKNSQRMLRLDGIMAPTNKCYFRNNEAPWRFTLCWLLFGVPGRTSILILGPMQAPLAGLASGLIPKFRLRRGCSHRARVFGLVSVS